MKVSIITTCYNACDTIADAIRSVNEQSYNNIEHIIVDGASTDGTIDIIERSSSCARKIVSEPDKGIYDALNKGIDIATGTIIGILHADDIFYNERIIESIVDAFANGIDAIYGDLQYIKKDAYGIVVRHWKAGTYVVRKWRWGWMPPHPTFFCKKECFDTFGKYDLTFWGSADYELMLRFMYKHNIAVSYLPQVMTKMRVGGQSNMSFKNRLRANQEDRRAWRVNHLRGGFFASLCKPLRKIWQWIV